MGLDSARSWECVNGMAEQLERDKPYEAQACGMRHLDLTESFEQILRRHARQKVKGA